MKTTRMNLMIATAFLALATGVASAQALQAEIPFAFRVGSKVMAPGTYQVKLANSSQYVVVLSNYQSKDAAIVVASGQSDPSKDWKASGAPMLTFECGISRCELSRLWTGAAAPALNFPHRGIGRDERASVTEIRLVKAAE